MKLLILNGSPNKNGNTYKSLYSYAKHLEQQNKYSEMVFLQIPTNLQGCLGCSSCKSNCWKLQHLTDFLNEIISCDDLLIGSPVYLDTPTAQTIALFHRLNGIAESSKRQVFLNKRLYTLATSYCSGTKATIHILLNMGEMLGFQIPTRGSREWSVIWKDNKLRGGLDPHKDAIFIDFNV